MVKEGGNKKRGQVTIFVIVGIVIVAMAILIYIFYPKISSSLGFADETPSAYIQNCIQDKVSETVQSLSLRGGELNPENYFLYKDTKIKYLCYTNEYFLTCVMQEPMLKSSFEKEVSKEIKVNVESCMNNMKDNFRKRGYVVEGGGNSFEVEFLPERIVVRFNDSLTLTKGEDIKKYDSTQVSVTNNVYDLVAIANSILNWEATYGDSETTEYMNYYHNLKVEKYKQSEGTTIYILTNRDTGEKFQFASRSIAWPPGYGGITA